MMQEWLCAVQVIAAITLFGFRSEVCIL